MRPQRRLLVADGTEVDVARFRGERRVAPARFDEGADAEAGAGPEDDLGPARAERRRPDRARPFPRNCGQRQRLGLEIVEQQPLAEAEPARRLGTVDQPGRVGEPERAPVDRPGAADDDRTRPPAEIGDRRLDRLD